jgi:hypothetical protein
MCFVLIEWYLNGCNAQRRIVAVTLDQTYAYQWQQASVEIFITREALAVPFITTP